MARGSRALQAALGAVAGGFTGYAADKEYRAEQDRLAREEARRIAKEEADAKREAASLARELAREQRMALKEGWTPESRYTGLSPLDMPGATPRQPVSRQKIGDTEFVLPETEGTVKHRDSLMKRSLEKAEEQKTESMALKALGKGRKSEEFVRLAARDRQLADTISPEPRAASTAGASLDFRRELEEQKQAERESAGVSFLERNRTNPDVVKAYGTVLAANPSFSMGQIGYVLMTELGTSARTENVESRTAYTDKKTSTLRAPRSGALPPGVRAPASSAKPAAAPPERDDLDAAFDSYNSKKR